MENYTPKSIPSGTLLFQLSYLNFILVVRVSSIRSGIQRCCHVAYLHKNITTLVLVFASQDYWGDG